MSFQLALDTGRRLDDAGDHDVAALMLRDGVGIVFIFSKRGTRRRDGAGRLGLALLLDGPRRFGPGWKTTVYGASEGPLCDVVQFNAIDARVEL